jgi:hypothetical protein
MRATTCCIALLLSAVAISTVLPSPASGAPRSHDYEPAPIIAGMSEQQLMGILQEKMPLPVVTFYRKRDGDRFVYAIEMNPASLPVKSDVLTVSFELPDDASADELIAAIDKAAQQVRLETIRAFGR